MKHNVEDFTNRDLIRALASKTHAEEFKARISREVLRRLEENSK